jgi:hypothetical protein
MKFLIDTSPAKLATIQSKLVAGQLLTPLTNYKNAGQTFAIDNGAFSGFNESAFQSLLLRNQSKKEKCLFVCVPDIVGNARRTRELYFHFTQKMFMKPWAEKWAFVLQDGMEDFNIEWYAMRYLFVGGTNEFKDSSAAYDIVKTAKALGVPVHVGRVNTWKRYETYAALGADTCDGSGVAKYDWMLEKIEEKLKTTITKEQYTENLFGESVRV